MSSIRDEISKIVDMRIPPNAYRRYLYEIDRTGGFNRKVMLDMFIVMAEKIEELENQVPRPATLEAFAQTGAALTAPVIPTCDVCGKSFTSPLGLMGHKRSHKDAPANPTKHDA